MQSFTATIYIIGINPFVFVPADILDKIFTDAGKTKGHIPVKGTVNEQEYRQTLVRYSGEWRLYINTSMLRNSPERIGEEIRVTITHDPDDRSILPHPLFTNALHKNPEAKSVFEKLAPSRQKEIIRYISNLKTEESILKNIEKAIGFLTGKNRFVGRDKP